MSQCQIENEPMFRCSVCRLCPVAGPPRPGAGGSADYRRKLDLLQCLQPRGRTAAISIYQLFSRFGREDERTLRRVREAYPRPRCRQGAPRHVNPDADLLRRSEEHTSELQSLMRISYA